MTSPFTRAGRLVLLLVLAVLTTLGLGSTATATEPASEPARETTPGQPAETETPRVVFAGVAGLAWGDVDAQRTPHLYELMGTHAAASMTVRTVRSSTCPIDGWLTLGAGRRASDAPAIDPALARRYCREVPEPVEEQSGSPAGADAQIPAWRTLVNVQEASGYSTQLGLIGDRVAEIGQCATAVGPGAALALADGDGSVGRYVPDRAAVDTALLAACPITVIDLGSVPPPAPDGSEDELKEAAEAERATAVEAIDTVIGELHDQLPPDTALLIGGIADSAATELPGEDDPNPVAASGLRVALAAGPAPDGSMYGPHWLTSASTRWTGLVQLTDAASTLLAFAGVPEPAAGTAGQPWQSGAQHPAVSATTLDQLVGTDRATQVFRTQSGPFFQILGVGQVLFFGGLWLMLRRCPENRARLLKLAQVGAVFAASFPVASFLANLARWWRFERADLVLWPTIFAVTAVIAILALAGPWKRRVYGPPGVIAALTAVVLAVDVSTGSNLQHSSLLGLSPLVAGRFYGLGNIPYAIFVAAVLVACAALAQWLIDTGRSRRTTGLTIVGIGLIAVVIIGSPWAGADVGGILATIPALAVLTLGVVGLRVTLLRIGMAGLFALAVFSVIAWLDWLRPATSRTHFGHFFADVLNGEAWTVITRKLSAAVGTLQRSPYYGWLVPIAYAAIIWLMGPGRNAGFTTLERRWSVIRPLVMAMLLAGAVGFAVNDSGIIVPALLLTAGIPLVVSALAHARRLEGPATDVDAEPSGTLSGGAGAAPAD